MLNLKHLYYFYIFSKELSTTKAAKRLGMTSPSLSNQLKQLEDFLDAPLTRRAGGKVFITERGEMVLHYANRMFGAYEDLKNKMAVTKDLKNTHFRVGICQNLGAQFSFDLLSLIGKTNLSRSKNVQVTFDSSESLLSGFIKDQFDLIFGAFPPGGPKKNAWATQGLIFPVRLFAPRSLMNESETNENHLESSDLQSITQLARAKNISFVLPSITSILRQETENFLLKSKIQPHKIIECNCSNAIVQLIERGFAMGFAPIPCLLDFKSARDLIVLGPAAGYWSHEVTVFVQRAQQAAMTVEPKLSELFK
jgi:DNA-binding transcriptional LysR family regulator